MADFGFTGEDVLKRAAELSPKVLLSFSTGKDSIGAALAVVRSGLFEDVQPFYMYQIYPNLDFIEESLAYYERTLFEGKRIVRMPHPAIQRTMRKLILQPPERIDVIKGVDFEPFSSEDVQDSIIDWLGWPSETFTALGVRAADSQNRYSLFKRRGMGAAVNEANQKFYPIFDWNKERLLSEIVKAGVRLPIDYRLFGKTFDGYDLRFIHPLRKHFPRDYDRLREWLPMVDVEFFRYEHRQG